MFAPCIAPMFLLHGRPTVGTFAQRGLAASSLDHCGTPVPITRDAAIPYPLFTLGRVLGYYPRGCFPKSLARRSPGYLPAVARLDAVLDPGGGGVTLVYIALAAWPASSEKDSARSKIECFSGLCVRFRATPFTSPHSLLCLPPFGFSHFTTGRLTRPYPGRPAILCGFLLDRQPLPGCPHSSLFRAKRYHSDTLLL